MATEFNIMPVLMVFLAVTYLDDTAIAVAGVEIGSIKANPLGMASANVAVLTSTPF